MNRTELCRKIGAAIRKHRLNADMSQENLSLCAGLHPAYIGRLERGEKCPTIDTLYKISEALNISIFDLLSENELNQTNKEIIRTIEESLSKVPIEDQLVLAKAISSLTDLLAK